MLPKVLLMLTFCYASCLVQAGFSGPKLAYGAGFNAALPVAYNSNLAPLPVAAVKDHFPYYNGLTYSASAFVKLRGTAGGGAFCGPSLRARPKFAFAAPVPAVYEYDAPLPVDFSPSHVNYNDYEVPNIVIKFGPPITTTTTSYSTVAAAADAVHVRTPFKAANGW